MSKRIGQLEEILGLKLFERTTRGAKPTKVGAAFIEAARRIVTDIENLEATARAIGYGEQGRLMVGHSSSLMAGHLKLVFSEYLTRYPDIQFDGTEGRPEELFGGLLSQTIDIAVAPNGSEEPGIASRPLWTERLMAVLHDSHSLLSKDRVYWSDLRDETFVMPTNGVGPAIRNIVNTRLTQQGFCPNIIQQGVSVENVLAMVPVGRFVTVVTEASQGVNWPGLDFRPIHEQGGSARIEYALYWRDGIQNPALQRFFDLINERYPIP